MKKKKPEEKKAEPVFNIRDIPAPHKIKAQLDDYVIGQEYAKRQSQWLFITTTSELRQIRWMRLRLKIQYVDDRTNRKR